MPRTRRTQTVVPIFRSRHTRELSLLHVGLLACILAELSWHHPNTWPCALILLTGALIAESLPLRFRKHGSGEIILLGVGVISYFAAYDLQSIDGWIRMLFVSWSLIPARVGMLRTLLPICALELVLGGDHHFLRATWLTLVGIGALFLDHWHQTACLREPDVRLNARLNAQLKTQRTPSWGPQLATLLLALCIPAWIAGIALTAFVQPGNSGSGTGIGAQNNALSPHVLIGGITPIGNDPRLLATVRGERPDILYLRALTVPDASIQDGRLQWGGAGKNVIRNTPTTIAVDSDTITIARLRGGDDIVIIPDGSPGTNAPNQKKDTLGNLFVPGQNLSGLVYHSLPGTREFKAPTGEENLERWRALPRAIRTLLNAQPELERWRLMTPGKAAQAISTWLQSRCVYSLDDLPTVNLNDPTGGLEPFLFGDTAQRRGHCQYFAGAATALLRSAGHSARPVIGFVSSEQFEGAHLIRAMHAHAWIEILDERGYWRRFDPTPGEAIANRRGPDPSGTADSPTALPGPDLSGNTNTVPFWAWAVAGIAGLSAIGFVWQRFNAHNGTKTNKRQRTLDKRQADIMHLAHSIGITVRDHHTLSEVVQELSERTSVDLGEPLRLHLAARFHNGELPPDWPIQKLKEAIKNRQQAIAEGQPRQES